MSTVATLLLRPLTSARRAVATLGRYFLLVAEAFSSPREFRKYWPEVFEQMVQIGLRSLPIVMLAAAFTGAVTTVQTNYQMRSPFLSESTIGAVVTPSIVLELGALIAAFILSGRVGAGIAAELGTMRVEEQIDAVEVMGLNAASYLVAPRVIAGTLLFPLLYVASCITGVGAGILMANASGILTTAEFMKGARSFFEPYDAFYGCTKAVVFGFLLTSISCFEGFFTEGGAAGVGRSATRAAVRSCLFILLADYLLAELLL